MTLKIHNSQFTIVVDFALRNPQLDFNKIYCCLLGYIERILQRTAHNRSVILPFLKYLDSGEQFQIKIFPLEKFLFV